MVSIVLPVYNESGAIEKVIDDIDRVMKKETIAHEIIVVDDGSTDNTAEISARVTSEIFDALKAPILRVSSLDVPTPASPSLEKLFYAGKDGIINAVKKLLMS